MDDWEVWYAILVMLVLGLYIGSLLGGIPYKNDRNALGNAICWEEYNMEFDKYLNDVLHCKPSKEMYDGIEVEKYGNTEVEVEE